LVVGFDSVVSAPPNSAPIATTAISTAATQAPIVRRGCVALASASLSNLVAFIASLSLAEARSRVATHVAISESLGRPAARHTRT
jgi:hypothetical protein